MTHVPEHPPADSAQEVATFGAGCFWCVEAVFQRLRGVETVLSGYEGGETENPTYQEICSGHTGHAEVARLTFDPAEISYLQLLQVFFRTHDPTTLNRQGADQGSQYRSVIFFHDETQRDLARQAKTALDESDSFDDPIVTEIVPHTTFFEAESTHQDYFNQNGQQGYCRAVIAPKVEYFTRVFHDLLKP